MNRKFSKMALSLLFVLCLTISSEAASPRLAIIDFQVNGAPEHLGQSVGELLRTELTGKSEYAIIERGQLMAVAKEQKIQMSGLVDTDTAVKVGKTVGASYVILGSINKFGNRLIINARLVDVQTAQSISGFEAVSTSGEGGLYEAAKQIGAEILSKLTGQTATTPIVKQPITTQPTNPTKITPVEIQPTGDALSQAIDLTSPNMSETDRGSFQLLDGNLVISVNKVKGVGGNVYFPIPVFAQFDIGDQIAGKTHWEGEAVITNISNGAVGILFGGKPSGSNVLAGIFVSARKEWFIYHFLMKGSEVKSVSIVDSGKYDNMSFPLTMKVYSDRDQKMTLSLNGATVANADMAQANARLPFKIRSVAIGCISGEAFFDLSHGWQVAFNVPRFSYVGLMTVSLQSLDVRGW